MIYILRRLRQAMLADNLPVRQAGLLVRSPVAKALRLHSKLQRRRMAGSQAGPLLAPADHSEHALDILPLKAIAL